MQSKQAIKILCPNCKTSKYKGVLFGICEDTHGTIEGKCQICGRIVLYNVDSNQFLIKTLDKTN